MSQNFCSLIPIKNFGFLSRKLPWPKLSATTEHNVAELDTELIGAEFTPEDLVLP